MINPTTQKWAKGWADGSRGRGPANPTLY